MRKLNPLPRTRGSATVVPWHRPAPPFRTRTDQPRLRFWKPHRPRARINPPHLCHSLDPLRHPLPHTRINPWCSCRTVLSPPFRARADHPLLQRLGLVKPVPLPRTRGSPAVRPCPRTPRRTPSAHARITRHPDASREPNTTRCLVKRLAPFRAHADHPAGGRDVTTAPPPSACARITPETPRDEPLGAAPLPRARGSPQCFFTSSLQESPPSACARITPSWERP